MHQTDNDNAMDATLFKSGTQTQRELDELVWTQTQETSPLGDDDKLVDLEKIQIKSQENPESEDKIEDDEEETVEATVEVNI